MNGVAVVGWEKPRRHVRSASIYRCFGVIQRAWIAPPANDTRRAPACTGAVVDAEGHKGRACVPSSSGVVQHNPVPAAHQPEKEQPTQKVEVQTSAMDATPFATHISRRSAVWCSAVRCGAVRCGAVRCGAVRCGVQFIGMRVTTLRAGCRATMTHHHHTTL